MEYRLEDLLDIKLLQDLQDKLNKIYSFPSAIVDNEGKVLTAVAWQDICTKFHRIHPQCERECIKSDLFILEHLHEANPAISYQCPHGLIDNVLPVIIDGHHLGNFFTGQFFLEKPDPEFFKAQAKKYGFDEAAYLEAVHKVPVWTKEKLSDYIDFIKEFIEIIAGIGLKQLKEIEAGKAIKESEEKFSRLFHVNSSACGLTDLETGQYIEVNEAFYTLFGFSKNEVIGKTPEELGILSNYKIDSVKNEVANKGISKAIETELKTKSGDTRHVLLSSEILNFQNKKFRYTEVQDITRQKKTEHDLRLSQQIIEGIINSIPARVFWKDKNLVYLGCNSVFANDAGFSDPNELVGKDDFRMGWADRAEMYRSDDRQVINSGEKKLNIEEQLTTSNGKTLTILTSKTPLKNPEGEVTGVLGTFMDITALKQAEKALRESEEKYRLIAENTVDAIVALDLSLNFTYVSPSVEKIIGYTQDEFMLLKFDQLLTPDSLKKVMELFEKIMPSEIAGTAPGYHYPTIELEEYHKDGSTLWIELSFSFQKDENNYPTGIVTVSRDISERRLAAETLRLSEECFREVLENSIDAAYKRNLKNNSYEYLSPVFAHITGYTPAEMNDMPLEMIFDLIHPDDINEVNQIVEGALSSSSIGAVNQLEYRFKHKNDGGYRWLLDKFTVFRDAQGNPSALIGSVSDITERKQVEIEYKQLIDGMNDTAFVINFEGKLVEVNKTAVEVLGYSREEFLNMRVTDLDPRLPENEIINLIEGMKLAQRQVFETEHKTKDGKIIPVEISSSPVFFHGKAAILSIARNLTERKQAENILHDIIDKNPMSIQIVDAEGYTLKTNPAHTALFGAIPPAGFSIFDDLKSRSPELEILINLAKKGEVVHFPDYYYNVHDISPDFPDKPVWIHAILFPLKDNTGKFDRFVLMHENITERKQAEKALRESEEKYRLIAENTSDGIFILPADGKISYVSPSYLKQLGYPVDIELNRDVQSIYEIIHPDDRDALFANIYQAIDNKVSSLKYTFRVKHRLGHYIWREDHAKFNYDINGNYVDSYVICRDINEQKLAEETIKKNERQFNDILKNSPFQIWTFDGQIYNYVNKAYIDFTDLETDKPMTAETWTRFVHPDDLESAGKIWMNAWEAKAEHDNYFRLRSKEGSYRDFWCHAVPIFDDEGNFKHFQGFNIDITERKQAQQELELHGEIVEHMIEGVLLTRTSDGIIVYANPSIEKMFRAGSSKLTGKHISSINAPTDKTPAEIAGEIMNNLAIHGEWQGKVKNLRFDGTDFWSYAHVTSFHHPQHGNVWVDIHQDITDRIQAETKIFESEKRARLQREALAVLAVDESLLKIDLDEGFKKIIEIAAETVEAAFASIWLLSEDEENLDCIASFDSGTGKHSRGSTLKTSAMPEYFKALRKENLIYAGDALNDYRTSELRESYLEPTGIISMLDVGILIKGKLAGVVCIEHVGKIRQWEADEEAFASTIASIVSQAMINSERMKTKEMLRESEQKFRGIYNSTNEAILINDTTTGQMIDCNDRTLEMYGYDDKEEILEGNITGINSNVEPFTDEKAKSNIRKALEKGKFTFDWLAKKKNGEFFWVEVSLIVAEIGGEKRILSVVRDISERKRAEQELMKAKEKAEESDRLKSAFLANMSHEIRTPMNGILGFAELLKEPNLAGEEQQRYIGIIENSGDRLLNIINNLIDISKIEAGQMEVTISETNINEQMEFLYTFFNPEAENKGLKLSLKTMLPSHKAFISTDREKVYAILTNLVKNAIKYTHYGSIEFGYVSISSTTSNLPDNQVGERSRTHELIELQSLPDNQVGERSRTHELRFYVKDTGIGIPAKRQQAIFDRFVQADIEDRNAYQGAGLGLSITKAYVEMLGGRIWVESEEGKGSTFYFSIPYFTTDGIKPGGKQQTSQLKPKNDTGLGNTKLKILIAEDDETSGFLIETVIKKMSRSILIAITGRETVELCRKNPDIDLILMDIQMPGLNGYDAAKQIRQFNKKVIIIAQTAYALADDKEKALKAGCNDYISKPISKENLTTLIEKYFK